MLTLRFAGPSPFVRMVRIAASLLSLTDRIELKETDSNAPSADFLEDNPLGKIPTLILEDGTTLFDSRVIITYLADMAEGVSILPDGPERYLALRMQALAIGLMDAALLQVYEGRFRPEEKRHRPWLDRQGGKVSRALASLEAAPPEIAGTPHVGHIALACALGYLDLRFEGRWREGHPKLVAWLDTFESLVPAYAETAVQA